jgi:hypothetical protein
MSFFPENTEDRQCSRCGTYLDRYDTALMVHARIGYGSIHDTDILHLILCPECLDEFIEECVIDPIIPEEEYVGDSGSEVDFR